MNSQEALEIIQPKPVVRGHRSRKRGEPADSHSQLSNEDMICSSDEDKKALKKGKSKKGMRKKLKHEVEAKTRDFENLETQNDAEMKDSSDEIVKVKSTPKEETFTTETPKKSAKKKPS